MKKIILFATVAILACSCEKFLDTTNYTKKDTSNYPASYEEVQQVLTGAYNALVQGNYERDDTWLWGMIMSDECFGDGGVGDLDWQSATRFMRSAKKDQHKRSWEMNYVGVWRCNSVLNNLEEWHQYFNSESDFQYYEGQARVMRAHFYFRLAKTFGADLIPLRLKSAAENLEPAGHEAIYGQIGEDLQRAIELLPSTKVTAMKADDYGRMTKWGAEALLAQVYLFYTGYYGGSVLPNNGSGITKDEVTRAIDDCVANSGHELVKDYRSLWYYANEATAGIYDYVKDAGGWIGDSNKNLEAVFLRKRSVASANNQKRTIIGTRGLNHNITYPWRSEGWGAGTVNPKFVEQWEKDEPGDPRLKACVLNALDPTEFYGRQAYDLNTILDNAELTGYYAKKWLFPGAENDNGDFVNASEILYGRTFNNYDDDVDIRFADVLLMHSELHQSVDGINRVRARVGLAPIGAYTEEALFNERCHELAFEGHRYYDILRWKGVNGAGPYLDERENGAYFYRIGKRYTYRMNATERLPKTGGFLDIPESEIEVANGTLTQNPGFGDGHDIYVFTED